MPKAQKKAPVGLSTKTVLKPVSQVKATIHKPHLPADKVKVLHSPNPPADKTLRSPNLPVQKTIRSPNPPVVKSLPFPRTPVNNAVRSSMTRKLHTPDTPVGNRDTKLRVRVCLELREETIKKKIENILEVTIIGVRNLPLIAGKTFNPFAKLTLVPDQEISTTELTINWLNNSCENLEIFRFPIHSNSLEGRQLYVDLCEGRFTRNSKLFGRAVVNVKDLKQGEPLMDWYELFSSKEE